MRPWAKNTVYEWLVARLAELSGLPAEAIDGREPFTRFGLDSVSVTALAAELSEASGHRVPPTALWAHPTPRALAAALDGEDGTPVAEAARRTDDPIAVVGLSCRFPGAPDADRFWELLSTGADAIGDMPADRWTGGRRARGGFLDQVDGFDPEFFDISPREAPHIDPQQRLVLELAWEALEDAGIGPRSLGGSRTGVFIGAMWNEYGAGIQADPDLVTQHSLSGGDPSIIPARVSYHLGLRGPSLQVNTACSSSLVAVHLAARSIRDGECELALAGGVSLMLGKDTMTALEGLGALSPNGRTKAFDASADGYGRGEGAGLVVLKPLGRAVADGDPIYCVIKGSAVNHDGFSNGLTAPSPAAQEAMLRDAYARAGVAPHDVQYVEAHGTGTVLGDPIEAGALSAVLGADRPSDRPLAIGSVKSNIGHLEPAAGVAGLIKVALSMRHRALPPTVAVSEPNPHIPFAEWRLRLPRQLEHWPADEHGRLVAGVSAFGFGGTNCHVVLEGDATTPTRAVTLSADSDEGLRDIVRRLANTEDGQDLDRLTSSMRDTGGSHRLALSAHDRAELASRARSHLAGHEVPGVSAGRATGQRPRVVFVFGGQGSQWAGMGARLMRVEPAFRAALARCDAALRPHTGWSLVELLTSDDDDWNERTDLAQPAIFGMQVALAEMWRHRGVEPDAVAGMSMGEVAAAHVAGALSLDDAALIMARRSRLAASLSGRGAMAVLELSPDDTAQRLRSHPDQVWIAGLAGPRSTIISGDRAAVESILRGLHDDGIRGGLIRVDYASHCPVVDGVLPDLRVALAGVRPAQPRLPFHSCATGRRMAGTELTAEHWARTERDPWRFAPVVEELAAQGNCVFLDVNPHPVLTPVLAQHGVDGFGSLSRADDGRTTMIDSWGALYVRGVTRPASDDDRQRLLLLSARSHESLLTAADRMADHLLAEPPPSLLDVCHTAGARRDHHEHRLAVVTGTRGHTVELLRSVAEGLFPGGVELGRAEPDEQPGPVLVFSGQGSQWAGMGRRLMADEPVFRAVIDDCDELLRPLSGWSLVDELCEDPDDSRLARTDVAQPALFAVQVALTRLWRHWGVEPAAVIGHSVGEVAAAHVAGVLPLDEAIRVVWHRGRLMREAAGAGRMAQVELPVGRLASQLGEWADRVAVAAVNDPDSTVLSGDAEAVAQVLARLGRAGVASRELRVEYAFHSPAMEPARAALTGALGEVACGPGTVPIASTVTGTWRDGSDFGAGHWAATVRDTVRFADAVGAAIAAGHRSFVEIGPHPVLLENVRRCLASAAVRGRVVGSLQRDRDDRDAMLRAAGALHVQGLTLDLDRVGGSAEGTVVPLPAPVWRRERYWLAADRHAVVDGHPLLGPGLTSSIEPGTRYWQRKLDPARLPYLTDLRVHGEPVVSAAVFAELAVAAATDAQGPVTLTGLRFERMLPLDGVPPLVQVVHTLGDGALSMSSSPGDPGSDWVRHAVATATVPAARREPAETPDDIRRRCTRARSGTEHYRLLADAGLDITGDSAAVRDLWFGPDEVLARIVLPESAGHVAGYHVHPALLDAALQSLIALRAERAGVQVVTGIDRLTTWARLGGSVWVHARADGDLLVFDDAGVVVAEVGGVRLRPLAPPGDRDPLHDRMYTLTWHRHEHLPAPAPVDPASWLVLTDPDGPGHALARELRDHGQLSTVVTTADIEPNEPDPHLAGDPPSGIVVAWDQPVASVEALVAAVARRGWRDSPRLWLVTRNSRIVGSDSHQTPPRQAALWGRGATIALEHHDLYCTRIDLASEPDAEDVRRLANELLTDAADREPEVALRRDGRYLARLERFPAGQLRDVSLSRDGAHLVVTDDRELAGVLAEWLVGLGVREVVVADRSGTVGHLTVAGAQVSTVHCDVSDEGRLTELPGHLRGVVYAQSGSAGAWNLHRHSPGLELFMLFSSVASLLGYPGGAADAAVLDAIAASRRAQGRTALSINVVPAGTPALGVGGVPMADVTGAMTRALGTGLGQLAVMTFDPRQWAESFPGAAGSPLLAVTSARAGTTPLGDRIASATPGERLDLVEAHLIEQLALTVGRRRDSLDRSTTFRNLGLESLMAVELRNRLEATLGVELSVAALFSHATIAALAGHVLGELGQPAPAVEEEPEDWADLEHDIAEMSDAEAEAVLLASLALVEEGLRGE
ncbi:type I polyketide synthase [Pseudonocardia spinosispora]|uniref:type I polyketide synthase n=1 Tax=Pseudonocardia spinosispora TaxID=103441 RepID=UPI000411F455|nr:type I polyketide synthase [Pseudonocardia spinosispora]